MITTRSATRFAFVTLFRQVRDLVDREALLDEVPTARMAVLVDAVPAPTWTRAQRIVLQVVRDEYARRLTADAQRMTTIQILGALTPITDMTGCESQAVLTANLTYTEELTKRYPQARAACLEWFHSATTSEQIQRGPAPAVVAAVLRALNLR